MSAAKYNFTVNQSTSFQKSFLVQTQDGPKDLTGYTVKSEARVNYSDTAAAFAFTGSLRAPSQGAFELTLSPQVSATIPAGRYFYDVLLLSGSTVELAVEGCVTIDPTVTRLS